MYLDEIIENLSLKVLTDHTDFSETEAKSGYCSDLLSCVMTGADQGGVWITLMAHSNIIAVAALLDLSAIIITEEAQPDPDTIKKANEKDVRLLSSPQSSFQVVGKLWDLGLRSVEK